MQIEWSITVGSIITSLLTLFGFTIAALGFFYALRSSIAVTSERMLMLSGRMINVENKINDLSRVLVEMAVQDQKIINQTQRLNEIQRTADEWNAWVRERIDALERSRHES